MSSRNSVGSRPLRRNLSEEKSRTHLAFPVFATEQEIVSPYFKPSVYVEAASRESPRRFDVSPVVCRSQKNWDLMYGLKNI